MSPLRRNRPVSTRSVPTEEAGVMVAHHWNLQLAGAQIGHATEMRWGHSRFTFVGGHCLGVGGRKFHFCTFSLDSGSDFNCNIPVAGAVPSFCSP